MKYNDYNLSINNEYIENSFIFYIMWNVAL